MRFCTVERHAAHSVCDAVEQRPSYFNDFISLDLCVIIEDNLLFELIPGLYGTRMCGVPATILVWVRDKVGDADVGMFVEVP